MMKMITIEELQGKWDSISPYSDGFLLISGDHPLSFHIGYSGDAQKSFIVLNTDKIEKIASSRAISADCILLDSGHYALRFILNHSSLEELFVKLCWDLVDSSKTDRHPVKKIVAQYCNWMRLLQQAGNGLLSSSMQKGLIGELLYLNELIDRLGEENALNSWVGPEGSDQDFLMIDGWTEVKTTSISSDYVTISSLQQLDRSDEGSLVVYFMDKTTSEGSSTISLPEIVDEINKKIEYIHKDVFECKLIKSGYLNKDKEKYKETRYRLAEMRTYFVDQDFPRLTRHNVPAGISNAEYKISLALAESFKI